MGQHSNALRILVADDNPADVRLIREALRTCHLPVEIAVARDGREALDSLLARNGFSGVQLPDLVLLDLDLPGISGYDVLREIKSSPRLRPLPVVVFSSSLSDADVAKCYEMHANCFVRKPGDLDEMFRVLKMIVSFWSRTALLPNGSSQLQSLAAGSCA